MKTREQLLELLEAAALALRSYEHGNGSPELAKEIADALLQIVEQEKENPSETSEGFD